MKRKTIAILAVLAVIATPIVIKLSSPKPKLEVELAAIEIKEIQPSILASGSFVFRQQVQLSSEVMGKVAEVLVKEGDKVVAGQVLLRLDPTLIKAEVTQQQANLRNADVSIERAQLSVERQKINVDRNAKLAQEKFIDASRYDDAVHQYNMAKVDLKASKESKQQVSAMLDQSLKRLDKTEVRAPISGTATQVQIKVGETAVPSAQGMMGSSLMSIADVASIMAEVNVDESDIAKVALGQTVKVFPSAFDDQPILGKVEEISMAPRAALPGASQSKNYIVKLRLNDTQLALRTGMSCRVEIITGGGSKKPVVPLQAVLSPDAVASASASASASEKGSKAHSKRTGVIFTLKNGVVAKREIKLGIADDMNQEILSEIAQGEKVVIGPARVLRSLKEGDKVVEKSTDSKSDSKANSDKKSDGK
jgi:HlyD family secretion protein